MYPIPPNEKLIETRICRQCSEEFPITNKDQEMLEKLSPKIGDEIFSLPFPTFCPKCRKIHHFIWRNETNLFKRRCDATGKDIIAMYPPDSEYTVYEELFWPSDRWDAKDFGQEYDFSRSFFDQFHELQKKVPIPAMFKVNQNTINSEYCNNGTAAKNSYLCFGYNEIEDCYYSTNIWNTSSSMDCHCV